MAEHNESWDCREGSTYDASDSPADPTAGEDYNRGVFRYNVARGETHAAHFKMSGQHERSFVGLHHNVVYGWPDNYAFTLQEHARGYMIRVLDDPELRSALGPETGWPPEATPAVQAGAGTGWEIGAFVYRP